jgi:hypothetical protein
MRIKFWPVLNSLNKERTPLEIINFLKDRSINIKTKTKYKFMDEKTSISSRASKKINPGVAIAIILVVATAFVVLILKTEKAEAPAETKNQKELPKNIEENVKVDENPNVDVNISETRGEEQIGYLKSVYEQNGKRYLSIDYIQFLTGAEAEKDKRGSGECPKTGECIVENGYRIKNISKNIRTFEIAFDAVIEKTGVFEGVGDGNSLIEINFDEIRDSFSENKNHFTVLPVWIEINNNVVTKITQQYLP